MFAFPSQSEEKIPLLLLFRFFSFAKRGKLREIEVGRVLMEVESDAKASRKFGWKGGEEG